MLQTHHCSLILRASDKSSLHQTIGQLTIKKGIGLHLSFIHHLGLDGWCGRATCRILE